MSEPTQTRAIIVGVETYVAGDAWNLPGPYNDAIRFAEWVIAHGVPPENIALFLSNPAPDPVGRGRVEASLPIPAGVVVREPTSDNINRYINDDLQRLQPDLLWVHWGGHGVVQDDTKHVFCSDATSANKRNINLRSLLKFLKSDYFGNASRRQIVCVDACADHVEHVAWHHDLPNTTYASGHPVLGCRQFALYAARPGQRALNLDTVKTGLFSHELMQVLNHTHFADWPPDMELVESDLRARFDQIGLSHQVPTFYQSTNWNAGERVSGFGASPSLEPELLLQIKVTPKCEAFNTPSPSEEPQRYRIDAWVWRDADSQPLDATAWEHEPHLIASIKAALPKVIQSAINKLGDDQMQVELILPHELLEERFDGALISDGAPIGHEWPLVIRPFERLYPNGNFQLEISRKRWQRKWRQLSQLPRPEPAWACDGSVFSAQFFDDLRNRFVFLGFTLRPAADTAASSSDQVIAKVLSKGLPIAVWLHQHSGPPPVARQFLQQKLLAEEFTTWPETVRSMRACGLSVPPAVKLCDGLTLLWDNADRCPPDDASSPLLQAPL